MAGVKVLGLRNLQARFKATKKDKLKRLAKGLNKAGRFLQRESMKIVPVDTGALRASAGTRMDKTSLQRGKVVVEVFYAASYAIFVHEILGNAHGEAFNIKHAEDRKKAKTPKQKRKFARRGKNQQPGFLEFPARTKQAEIRKIVRDVFHE